MGFYVIGLIVGVYSVMVVNGDGCIMQVQIILGELDLVMIQVIVILVFCFGNNDGSVFI